MYRLIGLIILTAVPFLSSCAYQVGTNIKPTFSSYTVYDDKISGSAAVYVDATKARSDVRVTGLSCSAHKFPVDAEGEFKSAVLGTLGNLIENVQMVDTPLTRSQLAERGFNAMIFIKVEDMDIDLVVIPGFWSADMRSEADVVLGVKADTHEGRQLGTTVSGRGKATANAGGACEGGAVAISQALEEATKEALAALAERVSNSERLRKKQEKCAIEGDKESRAKSGPDHNSSSSVTPSNLRCPDEPFG
jgi:hypothetical protein